VIIDYIDVRESDGLVVVATQGNGVYCANVISFTDVKSENQNYFSLKQNYPNPCAEITTIGFTLSETEFADLQLFDIFGKKVKQLFIGFANKGTNQIVSDLSELPSGAYIYSLRTNHGNLSKKIIVQK
jgi:hypothetical protein